MATYVKYQVFVEDLAEKVHNLGSDTLKVALTNTAPNVSTHAGLADITEISAGFGYTAGGTQATISTSAQAAGTYKLVLADVVFTAAGGSMGTARYFVLYNDTSTGDKLIAYWDYGTSFTLLTGETATLDADVGTGVLTIA